ncbi:unnamed protein product [Protopolystoma xenopodis]|uniref:Uncharacterized protein n=1 Tax=Protopolystoma xenopodis TaxID=117903 RepID=A0A3S5AJP7_9PLAT|nr:unnamed protein product [Protopolystoma xenopodis]
MPIQESGAGPRATLRRPTSPERTPSTAASGTNTHQTGPSNTAAVTEPFEPLLATDVLCPPVSRRHHASLPLLHSSPGPANLLTCPQYPGDHRPQYPSAPPPCYDQATREAGLCPGRHPSSGQLAGIATPPSYSVCDFLLAGYRLFQPTWTTPSAGGGEDRSTATADCRRLSHAPHDVWLQHVFHTSPHHFRPLTREPCRRRCLKQASDNCSQNGWCASALVARETVTNCPLVARRGYSVHDRQQRSCLVCPQTSWLGRSLGRSEGRVCRASAPFEMEDGLDEAGVGEPASLRPLGGHHHDDEVEREIDVSGEFAEEERMMALVRGAVTMDLEMAYPAKTIGLARKEQSEALRYAEEAAFLKEKEAIAKCMRSSGFSSRSRCNSFENCEAWLAS